MTDGGAIVCAASRWYINAALSCAIVNAGLLVSSSKSHSPPTGSSTQRRLCWLKSPRRGAPYGCGNHVVAGTKASTDADNVVSGWENNRLGGEENGCPCGTTGGCIVVRRCEGPALFRGATAAGAGASLPQVCCPDADNCPRFFPSTCEETPPPD